MDAPRYRTRAGIHRGASVNARLQAALAPLWREIELDAQRRETEMARRDPAKHKLSKLMEAGSHYRYWSGGKDGRGRTVRFCYSTGRKRCRLLLGLAGSCNAGQAQGQAEGRRSRLDHHPRSMGGAQGSEAGMRFG